MRRGARGLLVAAVALLGLLATACADEVEPEAVAATLVASPVPAEVDEPAREPTPTPSPTPSELPSPGTPRASTDADRADFVANYRPEGATQLRHLSMDVDGDGERELLFAMVGGDGLSRVDVAVWDGTRYVVASSDHGGQADRLEDLQLRELTGDGAVEVAVIQSVGASGASVSLWSIGPGGLLVPLVAEGGCFGGSHTYGATHVDIGGRTADGRSVIRGSCEETGSPPPLWPIAVYSWQAGAYRCDHVEHVEGGTGPCEGDGDGEAGGTGEDGEPGPGASHPTSGSTRRPSE